MKTRDDSTMERVIFGLVLLLIAGVLFLCHGCAIGGPCRKDLSTPTRERYAELLHECREHYREAERLLRESEKTCPQVPEQTFDGIGFGEAGH